MERKCREQIQDILEGHCDDTCLDVKVERREEKRRLLLGGGLANISMMMTFTEMRNRGDQVWAFSHTNPELTFRHPFKISEKVDTQSCR